MNRQIIQEAAEWFVELNAEPASDLATRQRFDRWLRASPEHVRAFLEVVPIWEDGTQLPADGEATAQRLIEWARAGGVGNVVPLEVVALESVEDRKVAHAGTPERARRFRLPRFMTAASVLFGLLAVGIFWGYQLIYFPTYATGIGEQRSF